MDVPTDERDRLEACPLLTRAFALLGKRWNALILDVLSVRPARFSEIHRAVPGLSDRILGERLHELVDAGLLERRERGAATTYALTDIGVRLKPGLDELRAWAATLPDDEPGA
ncbi:MAG: helix-turn-helix domain-containing protein [Thermoleophilia bacterium]